MEFALTKARSSKNTHFTASRVAYYEDKTTLCPHCMESSFSDYMHIVNFQGKGQW